VPETVVTQQVKRTGTMPPPPPPPKQDVPVLIVMALPTPAPAAKAEPAPKELPKTASRLPLVGALGALFCGLAFTIMAIRKFAA